jgi:DNA-binding ferritin-like protein
MLAIMNDQDPNLEPQDPNQPVEPPPKSVGEVLLQLAGVIRGAELAIQSAHHRASGTGFAGDHATLLDELYTLLGEQLDNVVERAIGLTGDSTLGDANTITQAALVFIQQNPVDDADVMGSALKICHAVVNELEQANQELEASGQLTLGLSDLLPELASEHERFCYLLGQRVKMQQMPAPMAMKTAMWQASFKELMKLAGDANQLFRQMGTTKIPGGTVPQYAGDWANHRLGMDQYDPNNAARQGRLEKNVVNQQKASGALPQNFNLNNFKWHQENTPAPPRADPTQMTRPAPPQQIQNQMNSIRPPQMNKIAHLLLKTNSSKKRV